tara:strand:+ start:1218 stop:1556 length:339 start_codon:yes stop_codon:yes gene_type:complete
MNPRERMRRSNAKAVEWLLKNGYTEVWLKPHGLRQDKVYRANGDHYWALDLWNQWDGICIKDGEVVFIAIKTNKWQSDKQIRSWMQDKFGIHALAINVKLSVRKYIVDVRHY